MKHVMYSFLLICMFLIFTLGILTVESRTNRENNVYNTLKRATDDAIESVLEEQNFAVRSNEELVAAVTEMICNSIVAQDEMLSCSCGYKSDDNAEFMKTKDDNNNEFSDYRYYYQCPSCGTTQIADPMSADANARQGITIDLTTADPNLKLVIEVVEADYKRGLLSLNVIQEYTNPMGAIGTCEYSTTVIFDEAKIYDTYVINYYDVSGILIESYVVRAGDVWPEPKAEVKAKYGITQWGTNVGGGGEIFNIPSNVPADTETNNITQYVQYDAATGSVNLYGNYVAP